MPMRPEDLMRLMAQSGPNPMAAALGRYGQAPGGTPRPAPLPPSPAPSMATGTQSPTAVSDTADEDMLNQVSDSMGGGDMETAKQALVEMYQNGDPSDPRTLAQWRQAKQDFIDQYGEENLPDLPNDPDNEATEPNPDDEPTEGE